MAFEESFGGQTDPGRPYFYKHDARRNVDVSLVIIPVELEHRDAMNRQHGKRKRSKQTRDMEWRIPEQNQGPANKFLAALIWKDTVNGWIKLSTQEAVDLFLKELEPTRYDKDGASQTLDLKLGSEVLMDGRWTDVLRQDVLNLKMANWIVIQGTDAQAESDIAEAEDQEKNSQAGSTSDSETTPPLRNVSASNAN